MKVVLLAGGFGTRLSEETVLKPKPMVHIGGRPIIWHIMKTYSHFGFNDFIICLGYKGYCIKEYFLNYLYHQSDITVDLAANQTSIFRSHAEPWKVSLIDTGLKTMTGGRLKRIRKLLGNETFMMTYGDGVADVDIKALTTFHKSSGKLATMTAVQPLGRFGALALDNKGDTVVAFEEKPKGDNTWVNGGFFVLEPQAIDYIDGDQMPFEQDPLINLSRDGQLGAYRHTGFWQPMDTLRDKNDLEKKWQNDTAPWKVWEDTE